MATLGNLVVAVKADTSQHARGMRQAQTGQNALRRSALRLGATLVGIFGARQLLRGIKSIAQAFTVQEDAVVGLRASLIATGKTGEASLNQLTRSAAELQTVTRAGDEAIIAATASLALLAPALDTAALEASQRAIIGIAETFTKGDLESAALLIGKSVGTATNALTRYGIVVDTTATQQEKMAQIIDQSNTFFDVAKARANTAGGAMAQVANAFGDVKEAIGQMLATRSGFTQFLQRVTTTLADIATILSGSASQIKRMFSLLGSIAGNAFALGLSTAVLKISESVLDILRNLPLALKLLPPVVAARVQAEALTAVYRRLFGALGDIARENLEDSVTELAEIAKGIRAIEPPITDVIETLGQAGTGLAKFGKDVSDLQRGVQSAFTSLVVNVGSLFHQMEDDERSTLERMANAVQEFARSVERTILELAAKKLGEKIFGFLTTVAVTATTTGGTTSAKGFALGGVVGQGGVSRMVPSLAFAGAPHFAGGGIAGLGPSEVPAILHRGETVLPAGTSVSSVSQAPVVVHQEINLNFSAVDARGMDALLRAHSATIAQVVGDAAQDGAGFRRMLRGR